MTDLTQTPVLFLTLILVGYLFGSISSAIIVCKILKLPDPRSEGSRNPGATNVLRFGGKKAAAITLFGDTLKGLIPILIALYVGQNDTQLAIIGGAAFLGHLYPVFFGFRGGKGVATALGVIIGISWMVSLALLATWLTFAFVFKISSLSALIAAVLAPLFFWVLGQSSEFIIMSVFISALLIWRHRSNIRDLRSGKEEKIQ